MIQPPCKVTNAMFRLNGQTVNQRACSPLRILKPNNQEIKESKYTSCICPGPLFVYYVFLVNIRMCEENRSKKKQFEKLTLSYIGIQYLPPFFQMVQIVYFSFPRLRFRLHLLLQYLMPKTPMVQY